MSFSIANKQDGQILTLKGALTIHNARELAARLGEVLEDGTDVIVETAGLEDIDTCTLQLLCSLRKTVPELSFDNPSETFLAAVDRCGLRRDLLGGRENL
jgi:anti-anti-sigma regulatory factor